MLKGGLEQKGIDEKIKRFIDKENKLLKNG